MSNSHFSILKKYSEQICLSKNLKFVEPEIKCLFRSLVTFLHFTCSTFLSEDVNTRLLSVYTYVCTSIRLSVYMSVCLYVCLSVCMS